MTSELSVSIVIPALNGAATIGDTLTALAKQVGMPPQTEIIVVDNGSTDGTRDVVLKFPQVTLLQEPKPGAGAARNRGLHQAKGEIVAYLDADTVPTRRWLAELVAPFTDPNVILVAGRIAGYLPQTPAQRFRAQMWEAWFSAAQPIFPYTPSGNMAVRREHALAINGWAEDMPTAEDTDFGYRLLCRFQTQVFYQPRAILFHRDRESDEALRRQAWTYGEGLADMYLRHPEVARWDISKSIQLAAVLASRAVMPVILRLGQLLGRVSPERVEFATYRRLWSWSYWRGFLSMMRHGERRPL